MEILIDISEIQRGFSGIVHDLVGHIKILQEIKDVEISFLYIDYFKFSKKSESEMREIVKLFCQKEKLIYKNIIVLTRWNYWDKFLKLTNIEPGKINTEKYKIIFVQPNFYFNISPNTKVVLRVHDMIYISNPETISNHWFNKTFYINSLSKLLQNYKPVVLTNSNATSQSFLKYFPNYKNIFVMNCPIQDPYNFGGELNLEIEKPYLLFCSSIEPKKNIIFLCEIFEKFSQTHPEFKLVIIGKVGWKYDPIVDKIQNTKNVIWLQKVSDPERDKIYSEAKCFVFPSLVEGFGMPPLEAMRAGIPVLSSDIPVHREIQGDGAWYAKLGDVDDFVKKIEYIIDEQNKESVNQKLEIARENITKYNFQNITPRWIELLNQLWK